MNVQESSEDQQCILAYKFFNLHVPSLPTKACRIGLMNKKERKVLWKFSKRIQFLTKQCFLLLSLFIGDLVCYYAFFSFLCWNDDAYA